MSKGERGRKLVSFPTRVYDETKQMRDELESMSGRKVSMADTVMRGIECLRDAHYRGAWLSPREAAPVLKQRVNDAVAKTLGQFIIQAMPDTPLIGLTVDQDSDIMTVTLEGQKPHHLYMGPGATIRNVCTSRESGVDEHTQ